MCDDFPFQLMRNGCCTIMTHPAKTMMRELSVVSARGKLPCIILEVLNTGTFHLKRRNVTMTISI
jgi:hypothetical protein